MGVAAWGGCSKFEETLRRELLLFLAVVPTSHVSIGLETLSLPPIVIEGQRRSSARCSEHVYTPVEFGGVFAPLAVEFISV